MRTQQLEKPLSIRLKAGYGSAELGVTAVEFFIQVYLLKFYTDVCGLRPGIAGLVLALGTIWDAISDPLLGAVSDNTKSKWGKRRPFIFIGAPLLALCFVALFTPPQFETQFATAGYLLGVYLLVNTAMTVLSVPHMALGGELSSDPAQRTSIFGWRFLFANIGLFLAILLPAIYAAEDGVGAPQRATIWIALLLVCSAAITVKSTAGRDVSGGGKTFSWRFFLIGMRRCLTNKPFWPLLLAFVVGSMGRTLNASIALFYYELRLQLSEKDVFLVILLPFTFVISVSIIFWTLLARQIGKKKAAFWGILGLGLLTTAVYPTLPAGRLMFPLLVGIVGGFLVGAVFLLDAMVTDIADYDEWKTGNKSDGLYFGFWRLSSKLARALGLAASGLILETIGFVPLAPEQTPEFTQALAWLFGPGVGVFFMAAAGILVTQPFGKKKTAQLARALKRKRALQDRSTIH